MKVVINICYGGFNLSKECWELYFSKQNKIVWMRDNYYNCVLLVPPEQHVEHTWGAEGKNGNREQYDKKWKEQSFLVTQLERHDPLLVEAVEELGLDASGFYSNLKIIEIPDGVEYIIKDYDGLEHVAEKHRIWKWEN